MIPIGLVEPVGNGRLIPGLVVALALNVISNPKIVRGSRSENLPGCSEDGVRIF